LAAPEITVSTGKLECIEPITPLHGWRCEHCQHLGKMGYGGEFEGYFFPWCKERNQARKPWWFACRELSVRLDDPDLWPSDEED